MDMPIIRSLVGVTAVLALGSCSYAYELIAVAIGGKLACVVDPASGHKPNCIRSITVAIEDDGPRAAPAPGDDVDSVLKAGNYWEQTFEVRSCPNPFPILYGAPLQGTPFIYDNGKPSSVSAKPLRADFVYEVNTSSIGSGYGSGWFRINTNGRIENLSADPTPIDLLENVSSNAAQ
jgi:hypothetical protein